MKSDFYRIRKRNFPAFTVLKNTDGYYCDAKIRQRIC